MVFLEISYLDNHKSLGINDEVGLKKWSVS
jgi:hypothetical protein